MLPVEAGEEGSAFSLLSAAALNLNITALFTEDKTKKEKPGQAAE